MPTPIKQHQTASAPTFAARAGTAAVAALRALLVASVMLAVATLLAGSVAEALGTSVTPGTTVRAAVCAIGSAVALRSAFWSLVAVFVCLTDGAGRAARHAEDALRAQAPFLARRLLVGAAGASLVLAPLPASAVAGAPDVAAPAHVAVEAPALPGQVLAWPVTPARTPRTEVDAPDARARVQVRTEDDTGTTVVVRPGDTLWGLAAAALPAATDADLVTAWPVLQRLNHAVVGDDPRLLQPGTTLRVPASDDGGRTFLTPEHDRPETR